MGRACFENAQVKERNISTFLNNYRIASLEQAAEICEDCGIHIPSIVHRIQPIHFSDAPWAFITGCAAAIKNGDASIAVVSEIIGEGLQSFCAPGTISQRREIGRGHGRLAAKILDDNTRCFAFVAGHESFAAAEGAISIVQSANQVRKMPLRIILNGLGKDAAEIIARFNGFTYVKTNFCLDTETLEITEETAFSTSQRGAIRCYGANEMHEGVAIMKKELVDVSITGNGTNMVKFQHPVCAAYKKWCNDAGKNYFACASGGGIGRTLNSEDVCAGPASYGFTDMLSCTYADAIFAGSSSVPAHVEIIGFIGMGNNPIVGATVTTVVETVKYLLSK